ncbi:MAG: BatD family protein, partial [Chloroflexi bacterium]|nr:BatD family protein [Chloroflexota bacterium]
MRRKSHKTAAFSIVAVLFAVLASVSVYTASIHAQSPPVQSEVDRTELTTDEVLTLTVTIRGEGSISAPLLSALEGVNIVGRSTVSQTTLTNNQSISELVHEYRLRPTVDGPLTIGAVRVTIDGQTYTTDPITVEVHPGVSRPRTAQSTAPPATLST